jgi:hypothetical protein
MAIPQPVQMSQGSGIGTEIQQCSLIWSSIVLRMNSFPCISKNLTHFSSRDPEIESAYDWNTGVLHLISKPVTRTRAKPMATR